MEKQRMGRRKRNIRIGLLILFIAMNLCYALNTSAQSREPVFRWQTPAPIHLGERGEVILELINWDPVRRAPTEIFQGMAPVNAILSESSPSSIEEGVYIYVITIVPLEERNIVLSQFAHQYGTLRLNIPRLSIQVLPARTPMPGTPSVTAAIANETHLEAGFEEIPPPPFPETREKPIFIFQRDYERIIAGVKALWDEGLLAEALVELRRNERDSLVGPYLASLRREIEQSLSFGFTDNEKWRPLGIPLISYMFFILAILSAGIFLFVLGPRQKAMLKTKSRTVLTFHLRKSYMLLMISVLVIGLALIFLEERFGSLPAGRFRSPGRTAVLRETHGYRVPDFLGMVNDRFDEGQPVIVSDYGDDQRFDWRYVEAPDGRSGWVPSETVIIY